MAKKKKNRLIAAIQDAVTSDKQRQAGGGQRDAQAELRQQFGLAEFNLDKVKPEQLALPLEAGTLLVSDRFEGQCLLLAPLDLQGISSPNKVLAKRLLSTQALYLDRHILVLRQEILHQSPRFSALLPPRTLLVTQEGMPHSFMLRQLKLPIKGQISTLTQVLRLNAELVGEHLQSLLDIPSHFTLVKEDLFKPQDNLNTQKATKGTLVISKRGTVVGLLLDNLDLPPKLPPDQLVELFRFKKSSERVPIDTVVQRAQEAEPHPLALQRGSFLFTARGKIYFVWQEGVKVSHFDAVQWARSSRLDHPGLLEVSLQMGNVIGGPGKVVNKEEIDYIRDIFKQVGTTNILAGTLLLYRNVFYKFTADMPYAQSGNFGAYVGRGITVLNTFRKGATFSIELGGNGIEISDWDLVQVRRYLMPKGRMFLKAGTDLRICDERRGDSLYRVGSSFFYPHPEVNRPLLEAYSPAHLTFLHQDPRQAIVIGPQNEPKEGDLGASGEQIGDLMTLVNGALMRNLTVFVLDATLFQWKGLAYRANEELVFRPNGVGKIQSGDLEVLEAEWKIHPA